MMAEESDGGEQLGAPNMRTFSLNSDEAYAALCEPRDRPWMPNGALLRQCNTARKPGLKRPGFFLWREL
jgi:hypothetical protein